MKTRLLIPMFGCLALLGCKERVPSKASVSGAQLEEKPGPKIEYYTCSMHSFIHKDGPGNCPICGMKLVPVYAQESESQPHLHPSNAMPADRGRVSLGETKRQLIGVRTEVVEKHALSREIEVPGRIAYDPDLMVAQSDYLVAARTGGGDLGGLQGGLAKAAKMRLQSMGMSEVQIVELRRRGRPDLNLLVPQAGQSILVYASVFESDLPWVQPGMTVETELPGGAGVLTTELASVDPVLNPATRTATLRFSLANPEGKLKPDMYLKVRLKSKGDLVLAIPDSALLDTGTKRLAYVEVEEGRYEARDVKTGRRGSGYIEVLDGVKEGDRVVTEGNFLLDSESRLRGVRSEGGTSH